MSGVDEVVPLPVHRERPLQDAQQSEPPQSAWRLIAVAIGWVVLSLVCAFAVGVAIGTVKAAFQFQSTPSFQLLLVGLGVFGISAVLIPAAIVQGRNVGDGDVRRGLAFVPVSRIPIILGLMVALVLYAALRNYALFKLRPDLFFQTASASGWVVAVNVIAVVIVAPLAEELFFRGWLWNGLRRHWDALPTALLTTGFWLLLHLDRGIAIVAVLLVPGLLIALARQFGGSVRASIPLHAIYNLAVVLPIILMAFGLLRPSAPIAQNGPAQISAPVRPETAQPKASVPQAGMSPTVPSQPLTLIPQSWLKQPYTPPARSSFASPATAPSTDQPSVFNRDTFSGSESQIAAMNYVNADCSSGEVPEVRIVTPPAQGNVRLQQSTIPISRPPTAALANCNGKPVQAMIVLYQSKSGFTGSDTIVLDVDFRHGKISRFTYNVTVR